MDTILYFYWACIFLVVSGIIICFGAYICDKELLDEVGNWAIAGLTSAMIGLCGWVACCIFIFKGLV